MVLMIGHIIVRSLKPKTCDVNDILQKYSLDVLCIGETWLSKNINDDVLIFPGYTLVRKDRPAHFDRRGGGGVCILMRNNIQANTVALSTGVSGSRLESLWVSLESPACTIGVIYRPPNAPVVAAIDDLQEQLSNTIGSSKPVFAPGDTNFDMFKSEGRGILRYVRMLHM